MEFVNFNPIVSNQNEKYKFYEELCRTKFIDLIETNNLANPRIFMFYILLLEILFYYRSLCSKQFCIITFFSYFVKFN